MSDKDLTESIDDFFDVRSLAAVLIGFVLTKWVEVLLLLFVGDAFVTQAIAWPIIFVSLVIILANASRKTNGKLKKEEFEEEMRELKQNLQEVQKNE